MSWSGNTPAVPPGGGGPSFPGASTVAIYVDRMTDLIQATINIQTQLSQLFSQIGAVSIASPPGGANGNVQFNNAGAFGGLTNAQLTALIQTFSSTLSGAVPLSGGGTTNFLRADGTWHAPLVGSGTVTEVDTSGAGISGGPITTTGTLTVEWNAGTISSLGTGLSNAAGALTPQWQGGTVTTLGTGLIASGGTLIPQWEGGTVTAIANTLTLSAGSLAVNALAASQAGPSDPAGTTSLSGVMMGLAGTITPKATGKVLVLISGTIFNASAIADGGKVQIRYGTGAAPANGDALTGSAVGGLVEYVAATTTEKAPFSLNAVVMGLSAATAYWIDVSLAAVAGGTAAISDLSISVAELE